MIKQGHHQGPILPGPFVLPKSSTKEDGDNDENQTE
jgi:hypothetical protein